MRNSDNFVMLGSKTVFKMSALRLVVVTVVKSVWRRHPRNLSLQLSGTVHSISAMWTKSRIPWLSCPLLYRFSLSLFAFASFYQRIFQLARCSLPRKFSTKKVINYRCSLFGETKITKYFIIINFLKLKTSFLRAYMLMHKLVPICRVQCFSENILWAEKYLSS